MPPSPSPLQTLRSQLTAFPRARLVAVSKTRSTERIMDLYLEGQRCFGENHALELRQKASTLPPDIEWHFIGHLQTNKVKIIAPYVHTVHSVDSPRLLDELQKRALQNSRTVQVLLQVHIAQEEHKFGFKVPELMDFLQGLEPAEYPNLQLSGLMGMASLTSQTARIREEFRSLNELFQQIKKLHSDKLHGFEELSMGMSGDYLMALEEGSTLLRVGSLLFEEP